MRRSRFVLIILLSIALSQAARPAHAQDASIADQVRLLAMHANEGVDAAEQNDPEIIRREVLELQAYWTALEDQIEEQNPAAYLVLEQALDELAEVAAQEPADMVAIRAAFAHTADESVEAAELLTAAPAVSSADAPQSLSDLLGHVDALYEAAVAADAAASRRLLQGIVLAWPGLEGAVAAKSADSYDGMEDALGRASAALKTEPIDWQAVEHQAAAMRTTLAPMLETQAYTAFDAGAIILREGLEALLVVAALLTFLRRSNNEDKQRWIWLGAGAGVVLSLAVAVLLQAVFNQVAAGRNREIIEGATGLAAAAMLFYVSYWLHSASSLKGWRRYIDANTTQALARGNLLGLALLAMMAIFREGAETAVFYLGIAPAIAFQELLLGIGAGVAILAVLAWLILVLGVKLPLRFFFQVAGVLVFYLGFKFVGTGIHALQVAGVVPATPIPWLSAIPFFGIYPTWETLLPQLLVLAIAVAFYVVTHMRQRQTTIATEAQAA